MNDAADLMQQFQALVTRFEFIQFRRHRGSKTNFGRKVEREGSQVMRTSALEPSSQFPPR